jgi:hypothetical protein
VNLSPEERQALEKSATTLKGVITSVRDEFEAAKRQHGLAT